MVQNTALAAIPWAELTDVPNAQTLSKNLAEVVDKVAIPRFASAAARTSALSAGSITPLEGMMCYLSDVNRYEMYTGADWVPAMAGRAMKGVRITNTGNPIASTSGTTELDMPKYGMSGLTLVTNRYYQYTCQVTFLKGTAADQFTLRLRSNTAVSGTLRGDAAVDYTLSSPVGSVLHSFTFLGDSSITSLFLSTVRTSGAGILSYYGQSSGVTRSWAKLEDMGDSQNWSDIA